ncbi:MAG: hypothetical protein OFPI_25660 [Osedax symbiont Rs2]|nr:MAG: hypothetical protein OFPI_25660 [Osedax symbiont Rs2]
MQLQVVSRTSSWSISENTDLLSLSKVSHKAIKSLQVINSLYPQVAIISSIC